MRRQAGSLSDSTVAVLEDVQATGYTDHLLDSNTTYTYRIVARTGWQGVDASSNVRSGSFYAVEEVFDLPESSHRTVQAVALAVDAGNVMYVAATLISTTTADLMADGLWILFPDQSSY